MPRLVISCQCSRTAASRWSSMYIMYCTRNLVHKGSPPSVHKVKSSQGQSARTKAGHIHFFVQRSLKKLLKLERNWALFILKCLERLVFETLDNAETFHADMTSTPGNLPASLSYHELYFSSLSLSMHMWINFTQNYPRCLLK